jgi:hypothetical protein
VIPQRPEERVTRGDVEPAIGGVVAQRFGHRVGALAIPVVRDLAARPLVPQYAQRAGPVDDFRVVVDAEHPRHRAGAVARRLPHRHRLAGAAIGRDLEAERRHGAGHARARQQVVEPAVEDTDVAGVAGLVGDALRQCPEPRMRGRFRRQHGVDDAGALAALLGSAAHRVGDAQPAAHHAEGVADADQRRVGVGLHGIEEREERRFPGRRLDDPLAAVAAVVECRIDVAGAAGAQVEPAAAIGRRRHDQAAAHVARHGADAQAGGGEPPGQVAGRGPHCHDDGVVADVLPAVVHVEHEHVDRPGLGPGQVARPIRPDVGEDTLLDGTTGGRADVGSEGAPVVAVEGHGQRVPLRTERPF